MPDEPKPDSALERWADKIMRWLTPILLAYIATLATGNHNRGEEIEKKVETVKASQEEAVVKTAEVKVALDTRAVEDLEVTRTKLYGNWKALDWIAESPEDKKKADEAKKVYEDFQKKHPPK